MDFSWKNISKPSDISFSQGYLIEGNNKQEKGDGNVEKVISGKQLPHYQDKGVKEMKKNAEFSTEKFLGIKYEKRKDGGYIYASVPVIVRLTEGELMDLPEIRKDEEEEREFFMDILRRVTRNVLIDNMAVFDATDIVYGDQDPETICSVARMMKPEVMIRCERLEKGTASGSENAFDLVSGKFTANSPMGFISRRSGEEENDETIGQITGFPTERELIDILSCPEECAAVRLTYSFRIFDPEDDHARDYWDRRCHALEEVLGGHFTKEQIEKAGPEDLMIQVNQFEE